jgi:hypothetical protein
MSTRVDAAKEVAMENQSNVTPVFTPLAEDVFLSLGAQQIAYVKSIDLPDGAHAVGIYSADGKPMAAAPSIEVAQALIRQHELEPALVH